MRAFGTRTCIIFVMMMFACGDGNKDLSEDEVKDVEMIHVANGGQPQLFRMSEIANGVEYLPLRFGDAYRMDSLIANVDLFFVLRNGYILADLHLAKSIYSFDARGNLRFIISRVGRAPGEYLKMEDVFVSDEIVMVYDSEQGKVIKYAFDGSFVSEHKIPFNFYTFYEIEGHRIMYAKFLDNRDVAGDSANYRVFIANAADNVVTARLFPFPEELLYSPVQSLTQTFYSYEDSVTFIQPLDNTIYRVVGDRVIPRYSISFANNALPENYLDDATVYDKAADVKEKGYPRLASGVIENRSLLLFKYTFGNVVHTVVYRKDTGEAASFMAVLNDFDNIFTPSLRVIRGDTLYGILSPGGSSMRENFARNSTSQRFVSIFDNNGKENGNPIIVKYILK